MLPKFGKLPVSEITIMRYDYATGETSRSNYVRLRFTCLHPKPYWKVYDGEPSPRLTFEPSYSAFY